MMNNVSVSIIMLSHNDSKYVEKAVKSIILQTHQNWEVLYIDDASTDDTLHKVIELIGHDKRFKVSQNVFERGSTASVNTALKNATGRWIAFIGGDVFGEPQKLERQIAFMKEDGFAFSYTNYTKGDFIFSGKKAVTHKDMMNCCWPSSIP
jgi:glycosyltransferase involved in cell wall biosynthesis